MKRFIARTQNRSNQSNRQIRQGQVSIVELFSRRKRSQARNHNAFDQQQPVHSISNEQRMERAIKYRARLRQVLLYSSNISSMGIECSEIDYEPSFYHSSYRCHIVPNEYQSNSIDNVQLMNEQNMKTNASFISLTDVSEQIDHEPNVSRRDSIARSTSRVLVNKPSLFLADIFKKMTHEQRAKSISQLKELHDHLTKSMTDLNKVSRTASLPEANRKPKGLVSATSLVSEATIAPLTNESTENNENMISDQVDQTLKKSPSILTNIKRVKSNTDNKVKKSRSAHFLETNQSDESHRSKRSLLKKSSNPTIPITNDINSNIIASSSSKKISREEDDHPSPLASACIQKIDQISNTNVGKLRGEPVILSKDSNKNSEQNQSMASSSSQWQGSMFCAENQSDASATSMISRSYTATGDMTITDELNDDEQSKLINEQLKRNSLGLARDSLEILRHSQPLHQTSDERLLAQKLIDSSPQKGKSALKSRLDSSDQLPTPDLISYIAIDHVKGDKRQVEKQMRRRSLTIGGSTVISCSSPKPKRDSLTLLQERYSGSSTPHSGCYHLTNSDSRHVEFIRHPGDTITPALHIGRAIQSKYPSGSTDDFSPTAPSLIHQFDTSDRSKSEASILTSSQRFDIATGASRSLDNAVRQRTATTTPVHLDKTNEETEICLRKSDYDEMVRLILTPFSKQTGTPQSIRSVLESNVELRVSHRLTHVQNLILLIVLISFYIFVFIKSHYWQNHQ